MTLLSGAVLAGIPMAADASASMPSKQTSSCVACHTDAEKLKAEAATVQVQAVSALQAGKG